ncbi:hypothetical protein [Streptomyces sp. NPDC005322]|uniref:hypothetical protein n=1 Tax=Streptomyces sp. NPDC005322 TaxID=3157032 RepID=UPI0033BEDD2B
MTTDRPYTDDDLRTEAAICHLALSSAPTVDDIRRHLPDAFVESHRDEDSGPEATWSAVVGETGLASVAERVHTLIEGAADVSEWAINLGADGLEPDEHSITLGAAEKPIARIHFAFEPGMPDEMRTALVEGIGEAIADAL